MPIKPADHYLLLLRIYKSTGIKIIHRQLKTADALYCSDSNIITISSEHKNTLYGCYLLCHELGHYQQRERNEFPEFFEIESNMEYDEKVFKMILEAEMDAVNKANRILKMFGVPFEPPEFTKKGYDEAVEGWKKYYFKIKD